MKKIILALVSILTLCSTGFSQGTFLLSNSSASLFQYRDPFNNYTPTPIPLNGGKVEALWAPLGTMDLSAFQPVGLVVSVLPSPGRFVGGTMTIPAGNGFNGIAPGAQVSMVIRGWQGTANSWFEAQFTSGFWLGYSEIFTVDTSDPTMVPVEPPRNLAFHPDGFKGLIVGVPEPSALAMVVLGSACCFGARKRS